MKSVKTKKCAECEKRLPLTDFQFRPEANCYRGKCQKCMYALRAPRDPKKMRAYQEAYRLRKAKTARKKAKKK